ncbi:MAG: lysozyme [Alphaproteobacteria bacterium]|nr:lysozyme [Alphaproteobacteria bacterium]
MKITKEEAYNDAVYHLNKYVYPKLKHLNKKLEPQQLAAVCMFIYNAGENSFEGSKLCNAINNNESDEKIREAFSIVRKAGGGRSYGLIDRNGFSGSVYCCKDIRKCIVIKPTIAGSPDIRYYEYDSPNSRDPIQNDDLTFEVRNFNNVIDDIKKFQTESIEQTIVYTLPPNITKDILKQYGIHVGDKGRITTDISWDDAKNITSKSNKKWFNKNTSKQTRWYKHRSR